MKILNSLQMRQLDAFTMENESVTSYELTERASRCFADEI